MASDNDAETIKNAIETKSDLSYVRVMDKKLSGGQDGDILFHDALFAEPFELLATTIFKDNGWLTQQMKTGKTFLKNYFHLVDMLLPRRSSGKYGAQSSLFEILFSPDQRKREDDSQPARLEEKYIPDDAKEYLFQQDSEFAGMNSLPQPYSELDYAVESRDAWASLVRTDGANKWLIVSKQELFLFLFANVIVHLKRDRNYWPLFGASKGRQTYKFYQQLVRDYALYFDRQQRLKTGDPTLLRKYLQILGEVWLRRNVICRQARLGELDLHFEIDHFDINRRRIHGRLSQAYADVRRHPGYEQPSVELLRCVRDFTHQVCKLERAQAKNMGQRGANTPFRRDDCGFFRDALFEFLTLGMLHGDKFEMFVDIWMEYISEKNLDCGDERAWKALVCRRWYVCVVLLDVFLFRTKKRLQGRLDSKQLVRVEALLLKVQKHFALDGRLVQTLTDPDLPTSCAYCPCCYLLFFRACIISLVLLTSWTQVRSSCPTRSTGYSSQSIAKFQHLRMTAVNGPIYLKPWRLLPSVTILNKRRSRGVIWIPPERSLLGLGTRGTPTGDWLAKLWELTADNTITLRLKISKPIGKTQRVCHACAFNALIKK